MFTPIEAIFDHIESITGLGRPKLPMVDSIGSCEDWGGHDVSSQAGLDQTSDDSKMPSEISLSVVNELCQPIPETEFDLDMEITPQNLDLESRRLLYPTIDPDTNFPSWEGLDDEL